MVRVAIDVEGQRVYEAEQLVHNPPPPGNFEHSFSPKISGGDEVRIEIELNSDGMVNENPSNNLCVIEGIFRRPFHINLGGIGFNSYLEVQSSSGCRYTPPRSFSIHRADDFDIFHSPYIFAQPNQNLFWVYPGIEGWRPRLYNP